MKPTPKHSTTAGAAGDDSEKVVDADEGEPKAIGLTQLLSDLPSDPPSRRKIAFNPSAGEVHRREQGAAWRVDVDDTIRLANEKAREEQLEKRRWGIAKQIQNGLMHTYGINYGIAELATLLKEGLTLKRRSDKRELTAHEVTYVQLLAAAEKYDLKQLALLVDAFPKGRSK